MKLIKEKFIIDIIKLKYGKIVDEPDNLAYVSNKTLGKIFKMTEHKIAGLLRVWFEKHRLD